MGKLDLCSVTRAYGPDTSIASVVAEVMFRPPRVRAGPFATCGLGDRGPGAGVHLHHPAEALRGRGV